MSKITSAVIIGALALLAQPWLGEGFNFTAIGNFINGGAQAVGDAINGGKKNIENAIAGSQDAIGNAIQQRQEAIDNALHDGKEALDNAINGTKEFINNIVIIAKNLGENAAEQLKNISDNVRASGEEVLNNANKTLQNATDAINKQLEAAQDKVKELGPLIAPCYEGKITVDLVKNKAIGVAKDCVDERISAATKIVTTATDSVKSALSFVNDSRAACDGKQAVEMLTCFSTKIPGAVQQTTQLTSTATKVVTDTTSLVTNIKIDLEKCAAKKTAEALAEFGSIAANIAKCVAGVIVNKAAQDFNNTVASLQ